MNLPCPKCKALNKDGTNLCNSCGLSFKFNRPTSLANPLIILIVVISFCSVCGICGLMLGDKPKTSEIISQPAKTIEPPEIKRLAAADSPKPKVKEILSGAKTSGKSAVVITDTADLHETPNTAGTVIQTLPVGADVEIIRQKKAWFYVICAGSKGWLHGNTIKFRNADLSSVPPPVSRQPAVTKTPEKKVNPSGATARCADGTLSYSAHRRGTCSHHGGVALWY